MVIFEQLNVSLKNMQIYWSNVGWWMQYNVTKIICQFDGDRHGAKTIRQKLENPKASTKLTKQVLLRTLRAYSMAWVELTTPKLTSVEENGAEDACDHIDIFQFEYV
uniref:Uncharacterized protein n=1 Tax=Romanomermis culicivorax TaxID=13658 RepID=A0A915HTS5_ROMCU